MNISRRTILKSAAIGAATAIGSAVTRAPALAESDTVKVASRTTYRAPSTSMAFLRICA